MIWVLISSQAPLFRRSGVAIYQLLVFFHRTSILLKMCFSASDKMDDVPVWNKLAYFTNAHGINLFIFLLPPPVENILPYATFTSLNELSRFFFFLTEITLQPKLVRTSLYAWVWKLQNLVWHNFIIYHFPFVTFTSLKKKKSRLLVLTHTQTQSSTHSSLPVAHTCLNTHSEAQNTETNAATSPVCCTAPQTALLMRLTQAGKIL